MEENTTVDRQQEIRSKGFNMRDNAVTEFGKIKSGARALEDAVIDLGSLKKVNRQYSDKAAILKALAENDTVFLREVSNYYYRVSGIYQRTCNYFATMYRYDWYIVPEIYNHDVKEEKVVNDFIKILSYLDNSYIKKTSGDIALSVLRNGAYYGYVTDATDGIVLQELPVSYCRQRFFSGNKPAIEFNMRFFDDKFPDPGYRMKILNMFPKEFSRGYLMYKQGKLLDEGVSSTWSQVHSGWYMLDPERTVKFSFNNGDMPLFASAIPALIDLDAAQDLDRRKQMQKLLKILIQKLPMDKNGDLIFDVDEAKDIHNNAVQMLRRAIGVDVLTTFADIDSIDMSDKATTNTVDDLEKVERTVYNSLGISQNLFNATGNLSLAQSVLNDETSARYLLLQFIAFYDRMVQLKSSNRKKYSFRLYMLETTQSNYKELSKMYKEHVQIGYSKMLPQIALGHSQSAIINTAHFENEILHLSEIMIPPLMSSTLNAEDVLGKKGQTNKAKNQTNIEGENVGGRPEKADSEKSDKTLQNKESMS